VSTWPTFAKSLKQISTKHQLFHYLKVLPKKKSDDNFLIKVQKSFISTFDLPNNFFHLRNLFLGKIAVRMFRPKNAIKIGLGLIDLSFFIAECRTIFHIDVLSKLISDTARVSKSDPGYPLCRDSTTELYCSASLFCEEELSILERGLLVMLGISSFNTAAEVNIMERFYNRGACGSCLGEECVPSLVQAIMEVAKIARGELVACARLLRSCRHRIVLAPLRLGGPGVRCDHVELQLLAQLGYLLNTVMIDSTSTALKAIVQKLRFKLLSIKNLCKMFINNNSISPLGKTTKHNLRKSLLFANEGLGTFDQSKGGKEKKTQTKKVRSQTASPMRRKK
jgi:hypothetical protein